MAVRLSTIETGLVIAADEESRARPVELLAGMGFATLTAETGEEGLTLARAEPPRLVVCDVELPGISGYEVCHQLRGSLGESVCIILLSATRTDRLDRVAGLLIGADDYLAKPAAPDEFAVRIRRRLRRIAPRLAVLLTDRELEVLRLLADGARPADIAEQLCISPKTVRSHVEHILRKLDVRSQSQAVAAAYRGGLLGADAR